MMTSIDGRIDCRMTEQLPGVEEYYDTLAALDTPVHVSGRVTAEMEMATGTFHCKEGTPYNKEGWFAGRRGEGYEVVIDTHGTLCWNEEDYLDSPLLIVMAESVSQEYLQYLKEKNISWIVCGKENVDLKRACEILKEKFHVERMAVVGGGHINAGFLAAGLLDEVSLVIGAGIDGRAGMAAVFDGLDENVPVTPLHLKEVKQYESGAVWLRYQMVGMDEKK